MSVHLWTFEAQGVYECIVCKLRRYTVKPRVYVYALDGSPVKYNSVCCNKQIKQAARVKNSVYNAAKIIKS